MKLSKHARLRLKQRGISSKQIKMVIDHGITKQGKGGTQIYQITKKDKNNIITQMKQYIQALEKSSNIKVVVSSDNAVITAYHDY